MFKPVLLSFRGLETREGKMMHYKINALVVMTVISMSIAACQATDVSESIPEHVDTICLMFG